MSTPDRRFKLHFYKPCLPRCLQVGFGLWACTWQIIRNLKLLMVNMEYQYDNFPYHFPKSPNHTHAYCASVPSVTFKKLISVAPA